MEKFVKHLLDFNQIRIENTNHCAYKCQMCPREKLTRNLGFMKFEDFQYIIDQFHDFKSEIHIHGYGEPLLDNLLIDKINIAKKKHPNSSVAFYTTLGVKKSDAFFAALANSGLDYLMLSFYGYTKEQYKKIHGVDNFDLILKNLNTLSEVRKNKNLKVKLLVSNHLMKAQINSNIDEDMIYNWLYNQQIDELANISLHNYGNGREFNEHIDQSICSVAFGDRKKILQITWDLKVIPCCFDFNSSIILGDLKKQSLQEIFSSKQYQKFIKAHLTNNLDDYPICQKCDRNF